MFQPPKFTEKNVLQVKTQKEYSGLPFFTEPDDSETSLVIDFKEFHNTLMQSEYNVMFDDDVIDKILMDAVKDIDYSHLPSVSGYQLDVYWPEEFAFNEDTVATFFRDLNAFANNQVQKVLGKDLKNYHDYIQEEKDSELAIENENAIRNIIYSKVQEEYKGAAEYIIHSADMPLNYDLKSDIQRPSGNSYSLSRNTETRKIQLDILEASDAISEVEYVQRNNATLVKVKLSDECKDKIEQFRAEATGEVYKEDIDKKLNEAHERELNRTSAMKRF